MSFRQFVEKLRHAGRLVEAKKPLSKSLQAAGFMKALEDKPVFVRINESRFPVAANMLATRALASDYFGVHPDELVRKLLNAIEHPTKPRVVQNPACFEAEMSHVDLNRLPILFHCERDGGNYVSSAVVIASHKGIGQNVSFHRLMQISKDEFAIRIIPRHLHKILEKSGGELPVAICVGNAPNVLLAGACSVELGQDELEIANSLTAMNVAECEAAGCFVPAETEFTLIGRITREQHSEGPFVDLTETYDLVRQQPIVKVEKIYHRKDPIFHALLPGCLEHKLIMGMPREPTIYKEVKKVCECLDVAITPGGCSWLHGVVKIRKQNEDDGVRAVDAAFKGHTSMKHVVVVDDDIDIHNPLDVEWAIATRFQADRNLIVKPGEIGSSLDPSSDPETRMTTKVGLDATKPLVAHGKNYEKAAYSSVDWRKYL